MIDTKEMRKDLLKMALAAKSQGAHMGGSLSLVEIMAALYGGAMMFDSAAPQAEPRDRLILSKGHGVMAQYAAMKQVGMLAEEKLLTYKANGSPVSAHPSVNPALGIDFASGSLGQGLSLGVGVALGLRRKGDECSRVFVVLGDGECDEGAVWEAAMTASHYQLANVVAIIDRNGLQYDGNTEDVLALADFSAKWKAFGWDIVTVDGHNVDALTDAFHMRTEKPLVVIAETVKGKGFSFMEYIPQWHNGIVTQRLYEQGLAELEAAE